MTNVEQDTNQQRKRLRRPVRERQRLRVRQRLNAPAVNPTQDLYIGNDLKTGRIMVKDEDVCLHCGLCAERCPTGAWDMRKYYMEMAQAEHACHAH